jgi:2-C-methyl-D-erythritol 4-phosphate cytidylyltransferase
LTPQLFGCDRLKTALSSALAEGFLVTDEASAMEHAGYHPLLVQGGEENIKITRPADLRLSALYLKSLSELTETGDPT